MRNRGGFSALIGRISIQFVIKNHAMLRYKALFDIVRNTLFLLVLTVFANVFVNGQTLTKEVKLNWNPLEKITVSETESVYALTFEGSSSLSEEFGMLPLFVKRFPVNVGHNQATASLVDVVYEPLPALLISSLSDVDKIPAEIDVRSVVETARNKRYVFISLMPIRKNMLTGGFERIVSFKLKMEFAEGVNLKNSSSARTYAAHSVLATGAWYKISVNATGIYKLTYSDLKSFGIDVDGIDPRNIRIFGNGGGMLPESNAGYRSDDLLENAIQVVGESDGKFNDGDYVLFYGESPDQWVYNGSSHLFTHSKNVYSDYAYYFLTVTNGAGERIQSMPSSQLQANELINRFNDYAFYERDEMNLIKSGREWYDKSIFDITRERAYTFNLPNMDNTVPGILRADVAARSTSGATSFSVGVNGSVILDIPLQATSSDWLADYGKRSNKSGSFTASGDNVNVELTFNKFTSEATGYLNYLEVNVVRELKMAGAQMAFRSILSKGKNKVCEYSVQTSGQTLNFWDVSNPADIKSVEASKVGNNYLFRHSKEDSTISEFIAFDGSVFKTIIGYGQIENQDLHGTGSVDYIIVTAPQFYDQAMDLARFHEQRNNFEVLVTTPAKIYNEFSSGAQDITAIRDFMKMLYDRGGEENAPKHLLLFGDASYDYKDRIQNNTNFVPTFESLESLDPVDSYVTDDYFVILDENEGASASGALDMGVGRFIVQTVDEAVSAVNKIQHYCQNSDTVKNDWRNIISFVAEDWDDNLHLHQTEESVSIIEGSHPEYNIDKIYLDAYQATPTPGGLRNPAVNDAINKRVAKGALLMNYTGHGGELGWAHERVLEIPDIKSWTNINNMPAFVTATCEFSRFDDPGFVSAGEWVFLNPNGGGIALFTTTRPTFAGSNLALTSNFYNNAFTKIDGKFPKMGDLIMEAKNATGGSANSRKFILLGDPALQLAYPEFNVVTTAINNKASIADPDTLKALAEVVITGEVRDDAGVRMENFNGTLFPTVYDKTSEIQTVGNTGGSTTTFDLRKNIIYRGKVEVVNGGFSFTFMVPKDIAYQYGPGKISYYARSGESDASGYDFDVTVGGYNDGAIADEEGPEIDLYMNDIYFIPGGITSQNPHLLAIIKDTAGINTVGNGIGHDITAILDGNTQESRILNDYYVSDVNTFRSGILKYPYYNLSEGKHTITVKAWDVYNNSSEASIYFNVISSGDFALQHLMNFPNPLFDQTTFSFEYNQTATTFNVEIRIYSMMGDLVKTIRQDIYTEGFRSAQIKWDGTTDAGGKIFSGTYVYTLKITLPDGSSERQSSKMVVIH
jgi:hypothetical protein